jgi:hypothetical protein
MARAKADMPGVSGFTVTSRIAGRKQPLIICLCYDTRISYELEGESRYG